MTFRALSGILPLLLAAPAFAGSEPTSTPHVRPDLGVLLAEWRTNHGPSWRVHRALDTGYAELLAGGGTAPRWKPRDDADFAALGRLALVETVAFHGLQDAVLEHVDTTFLPLGMIGSTDKMTVRFRQVVNGVPVQGGFANVLFDMHGGILSIQSTGMPAVAGFATSPALDAARAARRAIEWFVAEQGLAPTRVDVPELVIDQFQVDGIRTPRLAWKVVVQHVSDGYEPVGKRAFVDAGTGAIYREEESIHHFDVSGSVTALASPGVLPDIASNPPTPHPMRFIRVTSGATTTFTDTNGDFNLVGVNAPASVTFSFVNGTWANVQNAAGAEYSLVQTLNAPTGNAVTMNSPAVATVTAQANCARVVPQVRDFVKVITPTDTHVDFLVRANTAVSGSCNAYYDGNSINFYNAGQCSNTAYSTIIAHEEGHWLNDRYGTGNGGDGMGEGNADVWAMYTFDTAIVGSNFSGGGYIRTGNNTRQYCGDANPGCYGQVHTDGEVWMGAAWKVRNRMNVANGNAAGDLAANTIFVGWMNAYNQQGIHSIIETQWLTLDDNDANINNGTPNYVHIDGGFRDQGFPGVVLLPIAFSSVTDLPDTQDQSAPYVVNASILANAAPPILSASILYRLDGGAFAAVPMTNQGGNAWSGQIPGVSAPNHVEYYLSATDNAATTSTFPVSQPATLLEFDVGIVHVLRFHNFDTAGDEGWTHATVGDTSNLTDEWERNTPTGDSGANWVDPSDAFSPSVCWGTDLGLGLDNGAYPSNCHMTLRTPIINCTGATGVRLRFKRWLSVQGSASDQARILVNGNEVYINPATNMNEGQWSTQEVQLGPVADNNASVQIEWRIWSNGSSNYGGWNIDDVKVLWLEAPPAPCATPQNYCSTSPNSVGPGAVMTYQGTPNLSTDNFDVIASGCPPFTVGIFFYGQNAAQATFGNGYRCVGGQIYRLPILPTDSFGDALQPFRYNNIPQAVQAGELWRFQYWYRNPAGGGAGFNLTDGLAVTFCP